MRQETRPSRVLSEIPHRRARIVPASRGIARISDLGVFLAGEGDAVVGWGRKSSGRRAQALAASKGLRCLLLEDGFLRSVERSGRPLSLVVDDLGIYYDASAPSLLERLIAEPLDGEQEDRAQALIGAWKAGRVSKYNHARDYEGTLPRPFVLLVDQTRDDASISHGQANAASFDEMLRAALAENPDHTILVKTHPDVFAGGRHGYFDPGALAALPRVEVIAEDCHPARLLEEADAVYTVTSQMGFEALIWGRRVRCFGMPFYAGWGLTQDALRAPPRRRSADLAQLVHAALVRYARYLNPQTAEPAEPETVIAHIALQRRMRARFAPNAWAVGFSRWKRPILRKFMAGSEIRFIRDARAAPSGATIAVWGGGGVAGTAPGTKVITIEDGFLRSVGLGADLVRPLSWVCDQQGIYYDASRPSALERILAETRFDGALIDRAQHLRRAILDAKLTKYNLKAQPWSRPSTNARVILVPGQVEDDASLRFGAPRIRENVSLLSAVRNANPQAYVVYKPHPDVVAGLRGRRSNGEETAGLCDEVVEKADMALLLDQVDEVHTITSLAGFEALLRGIPVTCYGQPFYAGWGLTRDIVPIGRRMRALSLDELVAGSLILYPSYVSRTSGDFITPEEAIAELLAWRQAGGSRPHPLRKALRPLFRFWREMTRGRSARAPGCAPTVTAVEAGHGRR